MAGIIVLLKTTTTTTLPIPTGQTGALSLRTFIQKQKPLISFFLVISIFAFYIFTHQPFKQGHHFAFIKKCCTYTKLLQYFWLTSVYATINKSTIYLKTLKPVLVVLFKKNQEELVKLFVYSILQ